MLQNNKQQKRNSTIFTRKGVYSSKRLYSERVDDLGRGKLTRIISKVYSCSGSEQFAVIQYPCTEKQHIGHTVTQKVGEGHTLEQSHLLWKKEKKLLRSEPLKM